MRVIFRSFWVKKKPDTRERYADNYFVSSTLAVVGSPNCYPHLPEYLRDSVEGLFCAFFLNALLAKLLDQ